MDGVVQFVPDGAEEYIRLPIIGSIVCRKSKDFPVAERYQHAVHETFAHTVCCNAAHV